MTMTKILLTLSVLGVLALGLNFGTVKDNDSGDSDSDGDGDSAFALTHRISPAPTAIQIQFRLIQS